MVPVVGVAEQSQVVLVDVLGDVEPVRLDYLLVVTQLLLRTVDHTHTHTHTLMQSKKKCLR